ncbi:MAG TPA: cupin domain-containing protein [Oscillatoriales cyanobacterium M59_W2019_021]|nr:cupin domain-containing protein [Oscillatoriales cyanobacterium M4454_W2019_049]HIK50378.1 cupin domain-containing protein [Oscillatoriales cyanobacterium M59_W2019_021]
MELKKLDIKIERQPSPERLDELGISSWPIWTKEVSEFPWTYDMAETCYFLEGDVVVTPEGGQPVEMGKGDLVTFPAGMSCTWQIRRYVKKHYNFS